MSNRERHTAQFIYTAEHELFERGEDSRNINLAELTRDQLQAGVREGHYEWFKATEDIDTSDSSVQIPEHARRSMVMAEACLHEMGLRSPRGIKAA